MFRKNASDKDLIRAYREEHETDAVDHLLEKYKPLVLRASRAKFLTGGERDDLLQEGMIGLYKAIRDYDPSNTASFATFASVCINNQMLKAIEADNRDKNKPLNESIELNIEEWELASARSAESPEHILIDRESEDELIKGLKEKMSPLEREVFHLFLSGCDYREIASITGRTPKSIDNAIQRIRKKAQECKEENLS